MTTNAIAEVTAMLTKLGDTTSERKDLQNLMLEVSTTLADILEVMQKQAKAARPAPAAPVQDMKPIFDAFQAAMTKIVAAALSQKAPMVSVSPQITVQPAPVEKWSSMNVKVIKDNWGITDLEITRKP